MRCAALPLTTLYNCRRAFASASMISALTTRPSITLGRNFARIFSSTLALVILLLSPSHPAHARPLTEEEELPPTHVIANHVVISEVQTAGANGSHDEFVELYNPSGVPQSLSTCQLRRKTYSGGTNVLLINDFSGHSIPADGYFLVAHADYSGLDVDLSFTSTSSNYTITDSNTLILECVKNGVLQEIDKLGFGIAGDVENKSFSQNPGPSESLERKAYYFSTSSEMSGTHSGFGNSYDSDNNSQDFVLQTSPTPQHSGDTERCCTTVAGNLTLQGRPNPSDIQVLMWPGSNLRATTDSSGHFSIPNVPAFASEDTAQYTIEASLASYLTARTTLHLPDYLSTGQLPTVLAFQSLPLLAGDLNGDNQINIFDLAIVGSQYGNLGLFSGDVNGDGKVNIQDLSLVSGNFGQGSGGYIWGP